MERKISRSAEAGNTRLAVFLRLFRDARSILAGVEDGQF
jgi:hypothetical protein